MKMKMRTKFLTVVMFLVSWGCVSLTGNKNEPPPRINSKTPLKDAIEASIDHGGDTLTKTIQQIKKRKKKRYAAYILEKGIIAHWKSWRPNQLINSVRIYQATNPRDPSKVIHSLLRSDSKIAQKMGWSLGAMFPSLEVGNYIDQRITEAISDDELLTIFIPEMADAVANNNLTESYTVLRHGLFKTNHVSFASGMIALDPKQASSDFLDYLAQASPEELRQINQESVNLYVCTQILHHLQEVRVPISHKHFPHLFFYAISRSQGLADMAKKVLKTYLSEKPEDMAYALSRLPVWTQVAFIEGSKKTMTPVLGLFFAELKKISVQKEILDEIETLRQ